MILGLNLYVFNKAKNICFVAIFFMLSAKINAQTIQTNITLDDYLNATKAIYTSYFFQGSFFVMALYMFILYVQNKKKDYLYYGIYLTLFFIYFTLRINSVLQINLLMDNLNLHYHLLLPLVLSSTGIYVQFIIVFANIKKYDLAFVKVLNIFSYTVYIVSILILTYTILTNDFESVGKYRPYIMLPLHIFTLYALIKAYIVVKSNLRYYILFSNFFLYIFTVIGVYSAKGLSFTENLTSHYLLGFYSFNSSQLGTFIEMIGFSLGLGYKFRLIEKEKNEIKEKYIDQLKENELVIERSNIELKKLLEIRTLEIEEKNKLLIKEQQLKLKSDFEQKLTKSELASLRARINPHFLFNSLNSIKSFIIANDVKKSVSYFSKFAKLLRYSLNHSSTDFVNLEKEIKFLKDYTALENLRLTKDIDFQLIIPKELEIQKIQVPPLVIQPFIENALWHGLSLKKGKGILLLETKTKGDHLEIHIIDNGIGREASRKINRNKRFKSKGISITAERLDIFSRIYNLKKTFEIIDLKDKNNQPLGTQVIIKLPLIYTNAQND